MQSEKNDEKDLLFFILQKTRNYETTLLDRAIADVFAKYFGANEVVRMCPLFNGHTSHRGNSGPY